MIQADHGMEQEIIPTWNERSSCVSHQSGIEDHLVDQHYVRSSFFTLHTFILYKPR